MSASTFFSFLLKTSEIKDSLTLLQISQIITELFQSHFSITAASSIEQNVSRPRILQGVAKDRTARPSWGQY